MKKIIILGVLAILLLGREQENGAPWADLFSAGQNNTGSSLSEAFNNRQSDLQVKDQGTVVKILDDDLTGSRHQRFILKLKSGGTVLVAHNIDLAPRIDGLRKGDNVDFFGEYEWNLKGGVIHWTHHDPGGRHIAGWLLHRGKKYQ